MRAELSIAILPGGTLGPVLGRTLCRAGQIAVPDERGEAELYLLLDRPRLELDEAVLLEVLVALLLLLRRVVSLVSDETSLRVAVFAVDLVVVLGLLHHHHLVDAALAGRGDGADIERDVAALPLAAASIVEPNINTRFRVAIKGFSLRKSLFETRFKLVPRARWGEEALRRWRRSQSMAMVVVVFLMIVVSTAVSLVKGKGVDQRLALAPVAHRLFSLLKDLLHLLDLLGHRLRLLPQRRDFGAPYADLVVPLGRGVCGHGGLGKRQSRLAPRVGGLRSRRGGPPSGRYKSLQR